MAAASAAVVTAGGGGGGGGLDALVLDRSDCGGASATKLLKKSSDVAMIECVISFFTWLAGYTFSFNECSSLVGRNGWTVSDHQLKQ